MQASVQLPFQRDMGSSAALPAAPSWFGGPGARCFGWYHRPAPSGMARDCAVVLCPPFGQEFLCSYRAYRHLAERLAAAGFPVLRFDYPGTGDAPGRDTDPDRVGSWLRGTQAAIDQVKRRSNIEKVCLFGMRLGATVAAFAASERGGVDGLALVAPCVSGGLYLREMRAFRDLRKGGELRPFPGQCPGDEEALGFVFRSDTIEDLRRLDLRNLATRPSERVLLVPRDDMPGQEKAVVKRLTELRADVQVATLPGYAEAMSDDPYFSKIPEAIWDGVVGWLAATWPPRPAIEEPPPSSATETTGFDASDGLIHESIVRCGEGGRLFGILTEPVVRTSTTAIVIANTGANHRAGANRFGVELARRLATQGITALRLDLGGLGDSAPPRGKRENHLYAAHGVDDLRAAIDVLRSRACRRIVLMGLCSGAYVSFQGALADPRVRGLIMINPLAFEWAEGREVERFASAGYRSTHYYGQTAFQWNTWKRVLKGEVNVRGVGTFLSRQLAIRTASTLKSAAVRAGLEDAVTSPLARKFVSLLRRGARVLIVFNSDEPMIDRLERDLGVMSGKLRERGMRVEMVDGADHVFVPVWSQARLAEIIADFIETDVAATTDTD